MAGTLNYKNYLNTLQTLTEVGNIFPNEQKRWTYTVEGGGQQGWIAEISWVTLIVDSYTTDRGGNPNFDNTTIFGYYAGGSTTEYSNGVINIPANMYSGPILPAGNYHTPITIVNIKWTKDGQDFATNIAFIQNWEPGVEIEDPVYGEGFIPIVSEPSTLTLRGPGAVVWQRTIRFEVQTDIPIFLGLTSRAYFFWDKPGGRVLLGTALFNPDNNTAVLEYSTAAPSQLVGGATYPVYAEFSGVRQYGFQRSNTVQQVVLDHIPLVVESETFTPNQSVYLIGETLNYNLKLKPDPSFPTTGIPVQNSYRLSRRDRTTAQAPTPPARPDVQIAAGDLVDGVLGFTETITPDLVDTSTFYTYADTITVTTSTLINNVYSYTANIDNAYCFSSVYDVYLDGPYAGGSRVSPTYTARAVVSRSITGSAFPITITQASTGSYLTEPTSFTLTIPNRNYFNLISLMASQGTSTVQLTTAADVGWVPVTNATSLKRRSVTAALPNTGTWSVYATYPGDLGSSVYPNRINLASTSSGVSHFVRLGNDLNPIFTFDETDTSDLIRLKANFANQLPRNVSIYQGTTFITSASWVRNTATVIQLTTATVDPAKNIPLANFNSAGYNTNNPNAFTLFRYKASTETTATYLANPLDIRTFVTTGTYDLFYQFGDVRGYNVLAFNEQLYNSFPRNITLTDPGFWPYYQTTTTVLTLQEYIGVYQGKHLYRFTPDLPRSTELTSLYKFGANVTYYRPTDPGTETQIRVGSFIQTQKISYRYGTNKYGLPVSQGTSWLNTTTGSVFFWNDQKSYEYGFFLNGLYIFPVRDTWPQGWYSGITPTNQFVGGPGRASSNNPQWQRYRSEINFGRLTWNSPNTSDAALTKRYSDAQTFFNSVTEGRTGFLSTATITFINEDTVYKDTNSIRIELPKNTITNAFDLRATWPGTLDLDRSFGKFNPLDTKISLPPATIEILPAQVSVVQASNTAGITPLFDGAWETAANGMFSTNAIRLRARVTADPEFGDNVTTGTATFFNSVTGSIIGTASVNNDYAELVVSTSSYLSSTTGTAITNYAVRFQGQYAGTATSTSTTIQVTNNSGFIMHRFDQTASSPFSYDDTGPVPVPPRPYDRFTAPIMSSITRLPIKTFYKADYTPVATYKAVEFIGGINMLLPATKFRGIYSPYQAIATYSSDKLSRFCFLTYATITYADNSTRRLLMHHSTRSANNVKYTEDGRAVVSTTPDAYFKYFEPSANHNATYDLPDSVTPRIIYQTFNAAILTGTLPGSYYNTALFWRDNWVSVSIDMDVAAWRFDANNFDNLLANTGPNISLGIGTIDITLS